MFICARRANTAYGPNLSYSRLERELAEADDVTMFTTIQMPSPAILGSSAV